VLVESWLLDGAVRSMRTLVVFVVSTLPAASTDQNWTLVVPSAETENGAVYVVVVLLIR
jgi:hypothetical protein